MKNITLILFLIFAFSLSAQQSGYMGKTIAIQYNLALSPALSAGFIGNTESPISIKHDFLIEKSINENSSIGFSFRHNDVYVPAKTKDGGINFEISSPNRQYFLTPKKDFFITHNSFFLVLGTYTGKANIAPFGSYTNVSLGTSMYSISNKNPEILFTYDSTGYGDNTDYKLIDKNTYYTLMISVEYGFKRIIAKDLYFSSGIACNINLPYLLPLGQFSGDADNTLLEQAEYVKSTGRFYNQLQHLFELKLGIGYFLF